MPKPWDCIILGAGFAGAAAAMHLADAGKRVLLLESRPYAGGRVRSFVDNTSGEVIDNGQHLLMGAYHTTLPLLKKLGTAVHVQAQKRMSVAFVDRSRALHTLDSHGWPGALGMARGMLGLGGVAFADKLRALQFALKLRLGGRFNNYRTIRALLEGERQGQEFITRFWEPMVLATMNATLDEAAPEPFLNVLRQAFLGSTDDMKLLFPTAGLSELLAPLSGYLAARNCELRSGAAVEQLNFEAGRVTGLRLKSGEEISAGHIISAVPARALERILPFESLEMSVDQFSVNPPSHKPAHENSRENRHENRHQNRRGNSYGNGNQNRHEDRHENGNQNRRKNRHENGNHSRHENRHEKSNQNGHENDHEKKFNRHAAVSLAALKMAIQEIEYSPIVSVYLWFDRDFVAHDFVAALGTEIQWVFNRRRLAPTAPEIEAQFPGHLTLTVSAADDLTEQSAADVVARCLQELAEMFAGAAQAQLLHSKVIKEKMATFRLSREYDMLRPGARTQLRGFYLAGDWTATELPATIEGAALSGARAAEIVLSELELRP